MPATKKTPSSLPPRSIRTVITALLAALAASVLPAAEAGFGVDPGRPLGPQVVDYLAGMRARAIGPATMSGRIAAVEGLAADPDTLYVGAATGGLWLSRDGGLTFEPLFDDQPVASIGSVAVFQATPDVVWVGTGEGNPRNSASVGNGVYRSLDGGRTWTHLGLEESERIHRIVLHPSDPSVAWVCALGRTWGENAQRGVFKTVDGGGTWSKVLSVDERTGCADLEIDPSNPMKLFAAMWDHRRWPWFFRSGGPGSGLYVTHDGGASWRRLTPEDGLPEGDLGRIGLAVAPSDPRVVYALVEAEDEKNLLLRSEDGGVEWVVRADSAAQRIGNRPFYYADLRVDPADPNRVYSLWSLISMSQDGGATWEVLVPFREVHPDHHALWIDPGDPEHLVGGNDGGLYVSRDRGRTWRFAANLPVSQFYHLRLDHETPYNVYGGLQDNGSWKGPSEVWENGGIRNHHWQELFFGDGFDVVPDPDDPRRGYAMSQEGYLGRWDLETGERRMIRPAAPCWIGAAAGGAATDDAATDDAAGESADCPELRFNWNAGIAVDPFDPATVYFGSQYVHRSTDRGATWTVISPDLTSDNPEWQRQAASGGLTPDVTGAENFTSITVIAPSPLEKGLLWVGSDDGRIHVTRDGGGTWESVEGNLRGAPAGAWVPHIEPSRFDPAEAFVVLDDHRRSDLRPWVFRTRDHGRSWRSLATPELRGYALAIVQDPVARDLLYLGTEFGLWISLDGGASWMPWRHGVPTVSVMDLALQPREHDLVLGTHGRGVYVLDDVRPLRSLSAEVAAAPLHLFAPPPAQQYRVAQTGSSRFPGHGEFRGENPEYGALITYSLNLDGLPHPRDEEERRRKEEERETRRREKIEAAAAGPVSEEESPGSTASGAAEAEPSEKGEPEVEIRVADASGAVLRTFEGPALLGLNRAVWDLKRDPFAEPEREQIWRQPRRGPEVPPGIYTVTLRYRGHEASGSVEVLPDPRFELDPESRQRRWETELRAGAVQEAAAEAIERVRRARGDIRHLLAELARRKKDREEKTGEPGGEEDAEDPAATVRRLAREAGDALDRMERRLWSPPEAKGIAAETDVWSRLSTARRFLGSAWDAPTEAQLAYLARAEELLAAVLPDYNRLFAEEIARLREAVAAAGLDLLAEQPPISLP